MIPEELDRSLTCQQVLQVARDDSQPQVDIVLLSADFYLSSNSVEAGRLGLPHVQPGSTAEAFKPKHSSTISPLPSKKGISQPTGKLENLILPELGFASI